MCCYSLAIKKKKQTFLLPFGYITDSFTNVDYFGSYNTVHHICTFLQSFRKDMCNIFVIMCLHKHQR